MSTKYAAKGIKILAGAAATPTTEIPALKEVSMGGGDRAMIDVSNHQTTNTKEQILEPLRDVRTLDATIFYDPADTVHERMRAAYEAGTLEYWTLVLPDTGNAQWAYSGYITSMTLPTLGVTGALECTLTFTASGAGTFTA